MGVTEAEQGGSGVEGIGQTPCRRGACDLPTGLIARITGPRVVARRPPLRAIRPDPVGEIGLGPGQLGLDRLSRLGPRELEQRLDLMPQAAERLAAAFELGRRVEANRPGLRPRIDGPEAARRLLAPRLRGLDRENFWALLLDARHGVLDLHRVSEGTLTTSLVHPREVFGPALRAAAAAVVVAHNHPSGDPEPSQADLEVTRRLSEAGELLGVPLLDHLVLAGGECVSLRSRGALRGARPWSEGAAE